MNLAKSPRIVGTLYGLSLAAVYSIVIVLSTPYLPPATSLRLSLERNWPFFLTLPSAFGLLMGLRRQIAIRGRCTTRAGAALGASTSFLSSFFSLFSLSLVGCCGLLALWISALLGTAAVVSLVELSLPLTLLALAGMIISILFTVRASHRVKSGPEAYRTEKA